jgi:pimeloyl-ACP methyl ester carboxylesterase
MLEASPPMFQRHLACLGPSGFHRIVYSEWPGPARAPAVLCAHGLTRNGRDFDAVAAVLSRSHRVVCPDMVGRGRSDWLANPAEYIFPTYLADCAALIARLDVDSVDWVGTSMGGLIGMMLAAQRDNPIRKLVLNDVGAFVSKEALAWLGSYVGADPTFDSLAAMEAAVRVNGASFGALSDAEWRKMTQDLARRKPEGGWGFAYDPRIGDPYKAGELPDVDLWPVWDAVRCPTLIMRGAKSNVLAREVADRMTRTGPKAKLIEFAGVGHAPALLDDKQIETVREFLLG